MNIKQLREITGLTQQKFGERFKIPLRSVQNWESGQRQPPEYLPRLIEMQLILEQENEQLRSGQTFFGTEVEQDPEENQEQEKEKSTQEVQSWTEKEKLASNILAYLDDVEISCKDCIYDSKECGDQECCIQNHRQYKEIVELIGRGAKE